jgi:hypothetical protein
MSESFAGITVPEGEPGGLLDAAEGFSNAAAALSGIAGEVRGMPGSLTSWAGPASVSFAGTCLTNSTACDTAVQAFGDAEHAARTYAAKLKSARERAKHAIADARDAQHRIDQAERDIADAVNRRIAAEYAAASASRDIALATGTGVPNPGAESARSQAESEVGAAADDEAAARRRLADAKHDLEAAQRRGHEAMDDARDAGRAAAAAFAAAAGVSPAYAWFGGAPVAARHGGAPGFWDTKNEGWQWWDEDQFLAQLLFFHPKNDEVGRYKWWGDQVVGNGLQWGSGALISAGQRLRGAAIQDVPWAELRYGRQFVAGPGGSVLVEALTLRQGTTTVIDADMLAKAGKFGHAGKALPIIGGAAAIASAGWDQWREDSKNPNLSTTDRVGRAAGVGTYVGGASIAGAAIGTALFPGVGTVAGLAIGAGAGLAAGAVASSITPVKEAMADAGQWTANAVVDAGKGIASGASWVKDHAPHIDLPDIKVPDLNPF